MGYASQSKLASSLPNKRPSFYSADRLGRWAPGGASINAAFRRRKPLQPGFARAKTVQPRLRREGNAPLLPPVAASPPEGEILAPLCYELLKLALREAESRLPPPGEVPPQAGIGVHFPERSEVCLFSLRAKGAVVWFNHKRRPTSFIGRPPPPPTGIYRHLPHRLPAPRFFTSFRMTRRVGRESRNAGFINIAAKRLSTTL